MASAYWRTNHTVATLLEEQEVGWEFLQLIKLLLLTDNGGQLSDDESVLTALTENIKFKASLASDFAPNDIRKVVKKTSDEAVLGNKYLNNATHITMARGALTTKDGPLPEPFVAWVKELSYSGDHAMEEFLNLFTNRLMALRYIISRGTRPNLIDTKARSSDSGQLLESLSGVTFNRPEKTADLRLAGLLANNRMSFPVAKQLLHFCMGIQLQSMDFYNGGWITVDTEDQSSLGKNNQCVLGRTASLGKKVWDQQKSITFRIEGLTWNKAKALMPNGKRHIELVNLLSQITDCRCDSKVILLTPENEVPSIHLCEYSSEKINAEANENINKEHTHEPLALGLSTLLSSKTEIVTNHEARNNKVVELSFMVKTSNPEMFLSKTA